MMKRLLACLVAMALLLPCAAGFAQETQSPVYLLVSRDENGAETPLGTAVLLLEKNLLLSTVYALSAEGDLYAKGSGGEYAIAQGMRPGENSELVLLTIAEESPAEPLTFSSMQDGVLTSIGAQKTGVITACGAQNMTVCSYAEGVGLIYTAQEGLLPGGMLLDEKGGLAGMVMASYGEGVGRYVAMTAENIYASIAGGQQKAVELPEGSSWVKDFTVRYEKGVLEADWSNCVPEDGREDCVFQLYCMNEKNPYYSYAKAEEGQTGLTLSCAPGQQYRLWLVHGHGEAQVPEHWDAAAAVSIATPEAEKFCKYAYVDHQFYLAGIPQDKTPEATELLPALETLDATTLTNPETALCLQAVTTYKVEEQLTANLAIILYTPEGYTFVQLGGFIFDPSYQENDVWHSDITELFEDYMTLNRKGEMAAGEYRLCYYLDGLLTNEMTFTLE